MDNQLAVFIDFENLAIWAADQESFDFKLTTLMEYLQSRGRIVIKRAYANWANFPGYRQELLNNSIDLIQIYSVGRGKNNADIRLAIDALEIALTHQHISSFVIVSGDSDFSPLVAKLREHGRHTLGIGPGGRTHALLVKSCDEFVYLENAIGEASKEGKPGGPDQTEARNLLIRALEAHSRQGNVPVSAAQLKMTMRRMDRNFDESRYGYPQFKAWLMDQQDLVKLVDQEQVLHVTATPEAVIQDWETAAPPDAGEAAQSSELPPLPMPAPFLDNPFVQAILGDLAQTRVPDSLPRAAAQASELAQTAMAQRGQDFSSAAFNFLQACRLQWEAIVAGDAAASVEDLEWYLASYVSSKAGELSQVHNDYSSARRYYLAFFALAQPKSPLWGRVHRLIPPMLSYYWTNAFRELNINTNGWHPGKTSPAQIVLIAAEHPEPALRRLWRELTQELAQVNPRLLQQVVEEAKELRGQENVT